MANGVGGDLTEGIIAEQPGADFKTREAETIDRKARDFFIGEPVAQRQRFEVFAVFKQALEAPPIARLDIDDIGQRIKCRIQIIYL